MTFTNNNSINTPSLTARELARALVTILELLGLGLAIYLVILPIYPAIKYQARTIAMNLSGISEPLTIDPRATKIIFKDVPLDLTINQLIIPKIGLRTPIIDGRDAQLALSQGAWHLPQTSTPDVGGNMVLSGHRFQYLPPNNLTFYLLNKIEFGDQILVIWDRQIFEYTAQENKIIEPTDVSILEPTSAPRLTLFTCNPVFSTKERLVVIAQLAG